MIRILSIPNMEKFWAVVDQSRGEVSIRLSDQTQIDLKRDHTARQLLRKMEPGGGGLELFVSDSADMAALIAYLVGAAREACASRSR